MKSLNLDQLRYIAGGCTEDDLHEVCPYSIPEDTSATNSNHKPYNPRDKKQSKTLYEIFMDKFSGYIKC